MNAVSEKPMNLPPFIEDLHPYNIKPEKSLKTAEEFIQAAKELIPVLKANAKKTNEIKRPTDDVIAALVKAGLYGMVRPKSYGGAGLELSDLFDVAAVLAEGCTSTAWAFNVQAVHDWLIGMLPKEGQDEILGSKELVIACGVFNSIGAKARAVEGGYMVSGRWNYGSGSTHSNWVCVAAVIDGRELQGHPEERMLVMPRKDVQILDTWNVRGLRGTGSHDVYIENEVFIPEHRSVIFAQQMEGTAPGGALHPETVSFRVPVIPAAHLAAAATCYGATKAALEMYKQATLKRVRAFTGAKEVESPAAAIRIGKAMVEVEAAQLLFQKSIRDVEAEIRANRPLTVEMRSKVRMVTSYAPNICRQIISSLVDGSSAAVLGDGAPLTTALLDVTAMTTHASLAYDNGPENYGRVLLGLEPSNLLI